MQRDGNPLTTTTCNKCKEIQQEIASHQEWIKHFREQSMQNNPVTVEDLNEHLRSVHLLQKQLAMAREEARAKAPTSTARAISNT
eukprot:53003-Rhodomonas_salina.1